MPVYYEGIQIDERRVDFFVEEKIMVEIKALVQIRKCSFSTSQNYLEAYNVEVGLLLNFGSISLQFKRLENSKFNLNPLNQ